MLGRIGVAVAGLVMAGCLPDLDVEYTTGSGGTGGATTGGGGASTGGGGTGGVSTGGAGGAGGASTGGGGGIAGGMPVKSTPLGRVSDVAGVDLKGDVAPDGQVAIGATYSAAINSGFSVAGQPLPVTDGTDLFVAGYKGDGTAPWVKPVNAKNDQELTDLAVGSSSVCVVGATKATEKLSFGEESFTPFENGSSRDGFAARLLLVDGSAAFAVPIGAGTGEQYSQATATIGGGCGVAGRFDYALRYGSSAMTLVSAAEPDSDVFVLRAGPSGELLGVASTSDDGDVADGSWEQVRTMAVGSGGHAVVVGVYNNGPVSFDPAKGALQSDADSDIFVAQFDVNAGISEGLIAQKSFGHPTEPDSFEHACSGVDAAGNVALAGTNGAAIANFGGAPLAAGAFLAVLDANLDHIFSLSLPGGLVPSAVSLGPDGTVLLVATFTGAVDLGSGALTSQGGTDVLAAAWSLATKSLLWATPMGTAGEDRVYAVEHGTSGAPLVLAGFKGDVTLGSEVVPCSADLMSEICLVTVELQP